jgi:uncharacterized protein with PIN domain
METKILEKNIYLRDLEYIKKCPNCGSELGKEKQGIVFEGIWEHYIYYKTCLECGMRIWAEDKASAFDIRHHEDTQDYDDPSRQGNNGFGVFKE